MLNFPRLVALEYHWLFRHALCLFGPTHTAGEAWSRRRPVWWGCLSRSPVQSAGGSSSRPGGHSYCWASRQSGGDGGQEETLRYLGVDKPCSLNVVGFEPVGFIAFDLDYYSSTKDAFQVFVENPETRLPRVYSYFDDIYWPEPACHNPYIGELAAIREFNEEYEFLKLCPINMLEWMLPYQSAWQEQIYVMHDFHHPLYSVNITPKDASHTQLPL